MSKLMLLFIYVVCVTLATSLAPTFEKLKARRGSANSPLVLLFGDSRRLFANQFFSMADVYFHSGYYPTIFDIHKPESRSHLDVASHEDESKPGNKKPDEDDNFMGKPRDWIENLGRNFIPHEHTHLTGHNAQEMLPWLKLAAEMDPTQVETYVTASYWLRTQLNQPGEAEGFLRQGLRANPDSPEIYLELGRIYYYDKKDTRVARNIWEIALQKWNKESPDEQQNNRETGEEILGELVRNDRETHNDRQLLADLERLEKISPNKVSIQKDIAEVKGRLAH